MLTETEIVPESVTIAMPHAIELTGRTILLGTDGSPEAIAALRIAAALAERHHAEVHVVSVMDTRGAPVPPPLDFAVAIADATIGDVVRVEQTKQLRQRVQEAVGTPVDWEVQLVLGPPASTIVKEARRLDAALVIIGLRRHGRADRVLHDETTLEVIRHADCPVLGVAGHARELPARALVAMDFGEGSLRAASAASALLRTGGEVVLAHVPTIEDDALDDGHATVQRLGVATAFAQCRAELEKQDVSTDAVVLHRATPTPIAEMLLEYADGVKCDLIAAGSARLGRIDRFIVGSVSTELVRDGRHSVLIVPPAPKAGADR
jgi:nucleotide-binding universal stress UspA family protein